jgi:hypothetical protein
MLPVGPSDAFGLIDPPRINATNHIYGGKNLPASGPSNILFVNGSLVYATF